jgi:hypothetical protein
MSSHDRFDIATLRINPNGPAVVPAVRVGTPSRIRKRRGRFVMVPWHWVEKLKRQPWYVHHVAFFLLYLNWQRGDRGPIKLASGMLVRDGVNRNSKRRALKELENLGLITVERRPKKSPFVTVTL